MLSASVMKLKVYNWSKTAWYGYAIELIQFQAGKGYQTVNQSLLNLKSLVLLYMVDEMS